jgi:hypothetical protein
LLDSSVCLRGCLLDDRETMREFVVVLGVEVDSVLPRFDAPVVAPTAGERR